MFFLFSLYLTVVEKKIYLLSTFYPKCGWLFPIFVLSKSISSFSNVEVIEQKKPKLAIRKMIKRAKKDPPRGLFKNSLPNFFTLKGFTRTRPFHRSIFYRSIRIRSNKHAHACWKGRASVRYYSHRSHRVVDPFVSPPAFYIAQI